MRFLDSWQLDLKLGLRMLAKHPGLTLAGTLGIAVSVAIAVGGFSVIQRNFHAAALPLAEGDRVVSVELWNQARQNTEHHTAYELHQWRDSLRSLTGLSAWQNLTLHLLSPDAPPETVRVAALTASAFAVTRVKPLLGRVLVTTDEQPGAAPVAVIGESVWRNRFSSQRDVLGQTLQLGATRHTIVGVMPAGFAFPLNHAYWIPLRVDAPAQPQAGPPLELFARLAPGVTLDNAQAELGAVNQRIVREQALQPRVMPYALAVMKIRSSADLAGLFTMQGLVVSLLVLVSLNVAILVYTRTALRQTEIGLRTALGASRGRIIAQLFVEALVLALLASIVGVAIAAVSLQQITGATQHLAAELPFWLSWNVTPASVVFAGGLALLAAVIIGVLPGLQATHPRLHSGVRIADGLRFGRHWTVLIVAQVAFAVALLPPSVRGAWRSLQDGLAGPGFPANEYLSAHLGADTPLAQGRFGLLHAELLHRLEADPHVTGTTYSLAEPGDEPGARLEAQDNTPGVIHAVRYNHVALNYFPTFAVPLQAGRHFGPADLRAQPDPSEAVIVNQTLAQRLFKGNALGRRLRYVSASASDTPRWHEIIGVVADFPAGVSANMEDSDLKVYHAIAPGHLRPATLAIHLRGITPAAFSRSLRDLAISLDPDLHLRHLRSLEDALRKEQWISRLEAGVLLGVTVSVLLLSAAGIYALMAFTVAQRRREVGIRLALGATPAQIVRAIFARVLRQLALGATLGALVDFAIILVMPPSPDPAEPARVLLAVVATLVVVGLLAAQGPTRRSLRIHPVAALREE